MIYRSHVGLLNTTCTQKIQKKLTTNFHVVGAHLIHFCSLSNQRNYLVKVVSMFELLFMVGYCS